MQKLPYIGIDLDSPSIYDFLREYFKAKQKFPKAVIKTYISNSGRGFHIEIEHKVEPLEGFLLRAFFNDCPNRLRYSMQKYQSDPESKWHDLLFQRKGNGKRKEIDMQKLLQPHKKQVRAILSDLGSEKSMQRLQSLSEGLKEQLISSTYYVTCLSFLGRIELEEIKKFGDKMNISKGIKYRIMPNYHIDGGELIFYCKFSSLSEAEWLKKSLQSKFRGVAWVKKIRVN